MLDYARARLALAVADRRSGPRWRHGPTWRRVRRFLNPPRQRFTMRDALIRLAYTWSFLFVTSLLAISARSGYLT